MTKARWMAAGLALGSVGTVVGEYLLLVRVVKRRLL